MGRCSSRSSCCRSSFSPSSTDCGFGWRAEHASHRHSSERKARWEFVSSPLGVIDLLAVLPFWFAFVLPADLRVLLVFRMVRFLKLARYSPPMRSLLDPLYTHRRALFASF